MQQVTSSSTAYSTDGASALCLVCNSRKPCPSVRSKQPSVCEACKKFFLRHRDVAAQQATQCATGKHDCDVTVITKRPCSACRLEKCFSVGMRFEDYPMRKKSKKTAGKDSTTNKRQRATSNAVPDDTSSSSQESGDEGRTEFDEFVDLTARGIVETPTNSAGLHMSFFPVDLPVRMSQDEDVLQKSLKALTALTAFESLPLRHPVGQLPDEGTWWKKKMEHFQEAARSATAYVRQLPAFASIPLADRPVLFANAFYPLLIADLALPSQPRGFSFLGMAENNRAEFLRYFSEFQMLSEDANLITEVFWQWNPTMHEFAILAALLFYDPCFSELQSAGTVNQIHFQLRNMLRIFLSKHFSDPNMVKWRLEQFDNAVHMLRRASVDHCLAIEMLGQRRPGFVSMNHLFYEVFMHSQKAMNGVHNYVTAPNYFHGPSSSDTTQPMPSSNQTLLPTGYPNQLANDFVDFTDYTTGELFNPNYNTFYGDPADQFQYAPT